MTTTLAETRVVPMKSEEPRRRGATRFEATNQNLKRLMETTGKPRNIIADELGISESFLSQMLSGACDVSRTIDRAAEGLLRRLGRHEENVTKLIVARVSLAHWPTISLLVKDLGGSVVDEFHALVTDNEGATPETAIVILALNARHEPAVSQLIRSTGGEIRRVVP